MDARERAEIQGLLTRLADGDRFAFELLYERTWPVVRAVAGRRVDAADADDVAQQALLAVFSRASEFDPDRDALAWMIGIATWECRTVLRSAGRRREEPLDATWTLGGASLEDDLVLADLEAALRDIVGSLSPADAHALRLVLDDARPADPTFRKRLQRALARLRTRWSERHGT